MKKVLAFVLAAMMVAAMFAGCAPAANTDLSGNNNSGNAAEATAAIKIGTSGPLTGDYAVYGKAVEYGLKLAVEEINALGGLQFEVMAQDDDADS